MAERKDCLPVISLPSSDTPTFPHAQGDDEEVGGIRGRAALARDVIGRGVVVRAREYRGRFCDIPGRDNVARAFADRYRAEHQEFSPECRDSDYERRLSGAYPIHPEVFDRLAVSSGGDVPDDMDARLVVLGTDYPYSKDAGNKAQAAAAAILQSRGNTPQIFQNTLAFLADQARLQDLDEAIRTDVAWTSILQEKDGLSSSGPASRDPAESAGSTVRERGERKQVA